MRALLRAATALLIAMLAAVSTVMAIPAADSLCPGLPSATEGFVVGSVMVFLFAGTFVIGLIVTANILSKHRGSRAFMRLGALLLGIPMLTLIASIVYGYENCPGYGKPPVLSTPAQKDLMEHG